MNGVSCVRHRKATIDLLRGTISLTLALPTLLSPTFSCPSPLSLSSSPKHRSNENRLAHMLDSTFGCTTLFDRTVQQRPTEKLSTVGSWGFGHGKSLTGLSMQGVGVSAS